MISPQKFSKSLGNTQLKIGLSFKELFICSCVPPVINFLGIETFFSFIIFLVLIVILAFKNKILAPKYLQNALERRPYLEWERINVKRD